MHESKQEVTNVVSPVTVGGTSINANQILLNQVFALYKNGFTKEPC